MGDKAEIIIADNGNSIPKNIIDKIFQPFLQQNQTGKEGIWISLSYDIVEAHDGEIIAKSKEGKDSEFIIKLPIA